MRLDHFTNFDFCDLTGWKKVPIGVYTQVQSKFTKEVHVLKLKEILVYIFMILLTNLYNNFCPPWRRRGSGLDCGSEDTGSIPGLPSTRVNPYQISQSKSTCESNLVFTCEFSREFHMSFLTCKLGEIQL